MSENNYKIKFKDVNSFKGLNEEDTIILNRLSRFFVDKNHCFNMNWDKFKSLIPEYEWDDEKISDSLKILNMYGFVQLFITTDSPIPKLIKLTYEGFYTYLSNQYDFEAMENSIIKSIYSEKLKSNSEISSKSGYSIAIINSFLLHYKIMNYLIITGPSTDNYIEVRNFTVLGKRYFEGLLK